MKIGLTLATVPLPEKPEIARRAQDAGFESLWTDDNPGGDGIVALTAMAAAAPHARLGSGILRAFTRHPIITASAFANLQALTAGGVVVGLGTGTKRQNLFQYGLEVPRPVGQLKSVIGMIREYWDCQAEGRPFSWADDFYHVGPAESAVMNRSRGASMNERLPIWVAAVNSQMLRFAGRTADGLAGHPCFSSTYLRDVVAPTVQRVRPTDARPFELAAWAMIAIDKDRDAARRRAARQIAFYLSTRAYQDLLQFYGRGNLYDSLRELVISKGNVDRAGLLFDDAIVDTIACTGTSEQVAEQLHRYDGLTETVVLAPAGTGTDLFERSAQINEILKIPELV